MEQRTEYTLKLEGDGLSLQRVVTEDTVRRLMGILLGGGGGGAVVQSNPVGTNEGSLIQDDISELDTPTPKVFLAQKRPMNETERIVCLAYYLAHYRNTTLFKTRDLNDLNREAAQPRMSNASVTARNATNQSYLTMAGGGQKTITSKGEDLVKALPDRAKVKATLEDHPLAAKRYRKKRAANEQSVADKSPKHSVHNRP